MQGLEFIVSQDPSDNGHRVENSGVWVIRKQIRRKRQGAEDEIVSISLYFIVGENIYMAPSVGSIISNRMVCLIIEPQTVAKTDKIAALRCHFCDQTTLNCICITDLHCFPWSHIPSAGPEEPRFCHEYTSEPD